MKNIILLVLLTISSSSLGQNWHKISKEMKAEQLLITPQKSKYIKTYYALRKKSCYLKKFSPVAKKDTVFILDSHGDWSDPLLTSIIWNKSDTIVCGSYDEGKTYFYEKNDKNQFTKYMMKLVSEWNIEEIRKEEIINGGGIPVYTNFAFRIIFDDGKYKIDCIYFIDFFNLKRDL